LAIAWRVASVALPMCGTTTTLSSVRNASGTFGSFSKTSSAAPAIVPCCSAVISAASSTTEPRATLTR
jgi:hypothetical protein